MVELEAVDPPPPRLRGVLHFYAFFAFLVLDVGVLALGARTWPSEVWWPVAVFALSVIGVFGTSALYHRVAWSPRWYDRVRRLDHAMIYGLVLGTYTPLFAITMADQPVGWQFALVIGSTAVGMFQTMFFPHAPKWLRAGLYVAVGWTAATMVPELYAGLGVTGLALLIGGGVLYSIGAVIYAARRPDPWPRTFGYHEIFHVLVIAAVAAHFALVTLIVAPRPF